MAKWIVAAIAALAAGAASAAEQPQFAPPPAWVKPAAIPDPPPGADGMLVQVLLQDNQSRFTAAGDEFYVETAFKILAPQGLSAAASLPFVWSPDTETLTLHRVQILRNGKAIDLLDGGKSLTILRREENLELAMLDGRLTATLQPPGLQVGDVIDMALTRTRRDPVFKGRSEAAAIVSAPGVAGRVRIRAVWRNDKPIRWRAAPGLPAPVVVRGPTETELVIDQSNVTAPQPPRGAPVRFRDVGSIRLSQFQSWAEVSALMTPLYAKAAKLAPDSPLVAELEKIRKASPDPKARAEAALRLAQDQIHYVLLGANFGGYLPADADVTWRRRFGDCKGKTVLLVALLQGLGIEAQPALVSTREGDALADRLPMLAAFDHVFVRATIGGKVYWLDPTHTGDRDLDDIPAPDFGWVLPVQSAKAQLERVQPKPLESPQFESLKQIDASAGYDAPAKVHVEQIFRGDYATVWRLFLKTSSRPEIERRLREYWRSQLSWVEPRAVNFVDNDERRLVKLVMDGQGKVDWLENGGVRDLDIGDSSLGFKTSFTREPGPNSDAPFAVPYPSYTTWTVKITLPAKGAGFRLAGAPDTDTTVAGRRFQRRSRLQDGVVTMVAQQRSLASEFPAVEAPAAVATLRKLYALDVIVRGPGTPRPDAPEPDMALERPVDAAGFSRRGVAYVMREDYDHAVDDFSAAVRLEPTVGKHRYNRGAARLRKHDDAGALGDFSEALRLNPKDALAYQARAELRLQKGDAAGARRDFEAAEKFAADKLAILQRRARAYEAAGRFEDAVRDLDTVVALSKEENGRAYLLNNRCWARAEWGRELDKALADCTAALQLDPGAPDFFDSRGFVQLRLGAYDRAIADFEEALLRTPDKASSLFGRGLAKSHMGRPAEAEADRVAARAAEPDIETQFARYGISFP